MNENIKQYAPVLIPTLNRIKHLSRLLESLSKCPEAKETELIIGLDYPPSERYVDGWEKIKEYLPNVTGFKKVTVIESNHNLGCIENLARLKDYFLTTAYNSVIITEDDNEFSPNFLTFMNWGLDKYKDDENVLAICGYNYPIDMSEYGKEYYFSHEFSAWGYGMTRTNLSFIRDNILKLSYIDTLVHSPLSLLKLTCKSGWRLSRQAIDYHRKREVHGDGYLTYFNYTEDKYCLFPKVSKVRNWGHDGSGAHCVDLKGDDLFLSQQFDNSIAFRADDKVLVKDNKRVNKELRSYFKYNSLLIKEHLKKIIGR